MWKQTQDLKISTAWMAIYCNEQIKLHNCGNLASIYACTSNTSLIILGFRQQAVTSQKLSLPENDSALHVFNLNTDYFYVYAPTSRPAAVGAPSLVTIHVMPPLLESSFCV